MAASKRALAALAAGALIVPLSPFASPAFAAHIDQRSIETACPSNQLPADPFTDVDEDSTFNDEITCIAEYDVTRGKTATTYDPAGFVSRQQMAVFIANILREAGETLDTDDAGFTDLDLVGNNQGIKDAINGLANAGVVVGTRPTATESKPFSPRDNVRRDQMASFIAQAQEALGREVSTTEDFFDDDDTNVHEDNINIIASEGITIGRGGDRNYDTASFVTREQMAAFLARKIDVLVEAGLIEARFEDGAALTVNEDEVDAGDPITGVITGGNIDTVEVSGDCVDDAELSDTTAGGDFQFSVPTNEDATAGDCELTFTVTFQNGRQQTFTETVTVNELPENSATELPELVSATVGATTTANNATVANPAGTLVTFTFDETIVGGSAVANRFFLFDNAGARRTGDTVVSISGSTVQVRFNALNTPELAAAQTVATVDKNAVTDVQGDTNPEGDARVGAASGGPAPLAAGITNAPDLVSVGNFRTASTNTATAVDFTFDEAAFVQNQNGFSLILIQNPGNAANTGTGDDQNEIECVGPAGNTTNPGGGTTTVAGGNGTTTITVICQNPGQTLLNPNGTAITAAQVARGTVDPNTVSDTGAVNPNNNIQAADVSNGGNTFEPDLVSVTFQPGAAAGDADRALFVFDQAVDTANFAQFFLYSDDATVAPAQGTAAVINTQDRTQVLVTFSATAADRAVGGFVNDGAVTTAATGTSPAFQNEQDEVGTANNAVNVGNTPGRTAGPDLTGVALSQGQDPNFPQNPTGFRAVYTFDEAVDPGPNPADFFLYLADGTQLVATTCQTGTTTTGTTANNNTVTCTAFNVVGGAAATSAQIGAATLGTVDDGAVSELDAANLTNPEGAEFTTGGTGTRTA